MLTRAAQQCVCRRDCWQRHAVCVCLPPAVALQAMLLRRCADVAAGLAYLHSRNVCHGDLKVWGKGLVLQGSGQLQDLPQEGVCPTAPAANTSCALCLSSALCWND